MPIITPPAGNFTPGAQFSIETIAAVINAAWDQANAKQASFEAKVSNATSSWLDTETPPFMAPGVAAVPSVTEPTVTIPASVDVTDIINTFDTKYLELVTLLSDKFVAFRTTYFPAEQAQYDAAEAWNTAAIADGGLDATVKSQLLADDKARALSEATRVTNETLSAFAARGFPLPPGAAAEVVIRAQTAAQETIAESGRKLTIALIEQMNKAVDRAMGARKIALDSAVEYIKALASGPDMASGLVNVGYDAQSKLISAAASFYNARTNAKQLESTVQNSNATREQEANAKNLDSELTVMDKRLRALLAEAQSLAQMATSLYNNVHASAGTSYGVNGT